MADELKVLIKKRSIVELQMKWFEEYFNDIGEKKQTMEIITELELRIAKVETLLEEFNEIQINIELDFDEDVPLSELNKRKDFEIYYYNVVSRAKVYIAKYYEQETNSLSNSCNGNQGSPSGSQSDNRIGNNEQTQVKLPIIKLPTFSGSFNKWLEFRDSFKALVHENSSISEIQKYYYLKSSLEGEASDILQSLTVSAANYEIAWDLLCERYENKRLIVHYHLKSIFDQPSLEKESHLKLRQLFDNVNKNLRALKSIGLKTEEWDTIVIYVIVSKFDAVTRRHWESFEINNELPSISDMNKFLKIQCEILEQLEVNKFENHESKNFKSVKPNTQGFYKHTPRRSNVYFNANKSVENICLFCRKNHLIYKCDSFLGLSIKDRINKIKKLGACLNCLRKNHLVNECKSLGCFKCKSKHHTLLHINRQNEDEPQKKEDSEQPETGSNDRESQGSTSMRVLHARNDGKAQVILSTAIVRVSGNSGKFLECRALLDSASQSTIITKSLCEKLGLDKTKMHSQITGVNEISSNVNYGTTIKISSLKGSFSTETYALVLPKITEKLPSISFNAAFLKLPQNIELADPSFNVQGDIDILLGANVFWEVIQNESINLGMNMPKLQLTQLGWVIGGTLNLSNMSNSHDDKYTTCVTLEALNNQIAKFWQIENCSNTKAFLSPNEQYCEDHFKQTFRRNDSGRFIVSIPFKDNLYDLGTSRQTALNRLFIMEHKLKNNPGLQAKYNDFLSQYLELGHMSIVNETKDNPATLKYYLPHHPVIKESSTTTKVRVVFDASAKTNSGLSLNDTQFVGPVVQSDLISILISFRWFNYIISGDIAMMYRQILLEPEQRSLQRILWRFNSEGTVNCYELNTVTYGTASAPYLATRCLEQIALEHEQTNPIISKMIRKHTYMDDVLAGAQTVNDLLSIKNELSKIFSGAGFELRKWQSNITGFAEGLNDTDFINLNLNEPSKTLGVYWDSKADIIKYSTSSFEIKAITKRVLLSKMAQIFDPLGLLSPLIIIGKLIIQKLWHLKVDWDEPVPRELFCEWEKFNQSLKEIMHLKIPRHVTTEKLCYYELHGFADASEKAYGACIYIRTKTADKTYMSRLLCAKSRVAPLKNLNLPRLELCAAHLLANLYQKVQQSLDIAFKVVQFWSDSTITLCWIKGSPSRWKTFVANRVAEIQGITNPEDWNHVNSADNPADLISRGMSATDMIQSSFWLEGPTWLAKEQSRWPTTKFNNSNTGVPEVRQNKVVLLAKLDKFELFLKCSSYIKLIRVTARICRFVYNCKQKILRQEGKYGTLSVNELNSAKILLITRAQRETFGLDYNDLLKNNKLHRKSKLLPLNVFLDKDRIIRVGGRIQQGEFEFAKTHPIVLPSNHEFTKLILRDEHYRLGHCGVQQLLSSIRDYYWPIQGRNQCKAIIRQCIVCFKNKPKPVEQLMGNLPKFRLTPSPPFYNTGIDYAGPLFIKDKKSRGYKLIKCYVCLFICLTTKAVHIEAVTDLTTESFLATLRRFTSRRGCPKNIYSDNGSNFIGAVRELQCLFKQLESWNVEIANYLSKDMIAWHFIPARTPNFGGIWEANIRCMKKHLNKIVGNAYLTYEELSTVLSQIESILNSRPLTPTSENYDDLEALTPSHFLIGRRLTTVPDPNLQDIDTSRLSRFQYLQRLQQQYWSRWSTEYICELQRRYKWQYPQDSVKIGSMVLLRDENLPPLQWQLGRVTALHPGTDGLTRVVVVKTKTGELKRGVSKICILPFEDNCNDIYKTVNI